MAYINESPPQTLASLASYLNDAKIVSHPEKSSEPELAVVEEDLYQHLCLQHIAWVLSAYQVNCVLDVGANNGQYADRLRAAGYDGHIVSFEPAPRSAEMLREAAAGDPRWSVHQVALGNVDATLPMNVVNGTGSSFLPPSEYGMLRWQELKNPDVLQVEVRRLDGLLDSIVAGIRAPRIYLKLDAQGYDINVFTGMGKRVREVVAMQAEVAALHVYQGSAPMLTALQMYGNAGFGITGMFPVTREARTGRVLEFDCVMVNPEKVPN